MFSGDLTRVGKIGGFLFAFKEKKYQLYYQIEAVGLNAHFVV